MNSMFEPMEGTKRVAAGSEPSRSDGVFLDDMTQAELLDLRARIDGLLDATTLTDLDIEKESIIQFLQLKTLQKDILSDKSDETPANQKAQVANAVASAIQALSRIQKELYTSERLKALEKTLAGLLNRWPNEEARQFFAEYEAELRKIGSKDGVV